MEPMSISEDSYPKEESQLQIAGFIMKTYEILNNSEYSKIIFWSSSGQEFVIKDINKFEDLVLPNHFRHSKINSFIRQLNMYGFHKSRKDTSKSIFRHPCFLKDRFDLLPFIKRKVRIPSRLMRTPVKKAVTCLKMTPKTKIQTEEKVQQQNKEEVLKVMQNYESKIRLETIINLNIPLSINSIGNSLGDGLENKDEDDVSLEYLLNKENEPEESVKIINPSMFINSFKE